MLPVRKSKRFSLVETLAIYPSVQGIRKHRRFLLLILIILVAGIVLQEIQKLNSPSIEVIKEPCSVNISSSLDENKRILDAYPIFNSTRVYLETLGFYKPYSLPERRVPVIATGASVNHFIESLLLLEDIRDKLLPRYPELVVHYWDLGLWESQKNRLKEFPNVVLRRFPFEDFPSHVSILKGYAWKPIIIQMMLRDHGFVCWVDSSIRFFNSNIDQLFEKTRERGIIFRGGYCQMNFHTDLETFRFLGEKPCTFDNVLEIEANFISVYRTQLINDYVMKPVVTCALQYGCMVTKRARILITCGPNEKYGGCHRFDQSLFTLVLFRIFREDMNSLTVPNDWGITIYRVFSIPILPESLNRFIFRMTYKYHYNVNN